jgi:prepilin-type N-terminal cleavage/methylation domain-containing protein/prepilin-type processing-associated H-X9-DG protein
MKKREGFTLIELLVVIAIIALLLAILMPSLNKVKDRAKDIVCRAHAKGIGRAIILYLEENDSRAFNSSGSNGLNWTDAAGNYLLPSSPDWGAAYWAVAYVDYIEDPKACGCPSYKAAALFSTNPTSSYRSLAGQTPEEMGKLTGFGLNMFFFRDGRAPSGSIDRYRRKISGIKAPFNFIIAQDHPEPKFEGSSAGGEQDDMMYVPSGQTMNLRHYRPSSVGGRGGRDQHYGGIFRHSKKNAGWDDSGSMPERFPLINDNPNGGSNTIFLDGHVDSIPEHTSRRIRERQYSGY